MERILKTLKKKCKNKGKIEASIASAVTMQEVSNFATLYYSENLTSVHNPPPHYNADENNMNLSLFRGQLGKAGASTNKLLTNVEWRKIMLYLLTNLEEVDPYIA
jgi:hypothetical protein